VPRVEDLGQRLRAEMKESVASALQTFEQSLDNRVWSRITALDNKLLEHSASLGDLSHRASQADTNLRKLANAVERVCDQRAPEPALPATLEPVPSPEPIFFFELPFVRQLLKQALAESAPPVARAVGTVSETDTLRWRIVREDEPSRRPRVTLGLT
jgi:hypothetical protein